MGFPSYLLLLVLLLPFANCDELNSFLCEKSSDNQNLISNAYTVVIILAKLTPISGFYQFSYGNGTEAVHGLSWCDDELLPPTCSHCMFEVSENIQKNCHDSIAASSWFGDFCYLRYGTDDFVGQLDTRLVKVGYSEKRVDNPENQLSFLVTVHQLLNVLKLATPENNEPFVAAKRWFYAENSTIHGKAQCTKDLTPDACSLCLATQLTVFDQSCMYRRSCQVLFGSCFMRYYTKKGFDVA